MFVLGFRGKPSLSFKGSRLKRTVKSENCDFLSCSYQLRREIDWERLLCNRAWCRQHWGTIVPIRGTGIPLLSLIFSLSSVFIQAVIVSRLAALYPGLAGQWEQNKGVELNTLIPGWWVFPPVSHKQLANIPAVAWGKRQTQTHTQCVCWLAELRDTFLLPSLCHCFWISGPWYFSVGLRLLRNLSFCKLIHCMVDQKIFFSPWSVLWVLQTIIHLILEQLQ